MEVHDFLGTLDTPVDRLLLKERLDQTQRRPLGHFLVNFT